MFFFFFLTVLSSQKKTKNEKKKIYISFNGSKNQRGGPMHICFFFLHFTLCQMDKRGASRGETKFKKKKEEEEEEDEEEDEESK